MKQLNVITIGYAKRALEAGTRERERMIKYASLINEFHVIVFTRKIDGYPDIQQEGNLFLYATNANSKIGMLWRAFKIGSQIISSKKEWIVSCQDPFETSLIGSLLARRKNVFQQIQVHGDVFNPRSYKASWLQRIRVFYGRRIIKKINSIRVVSERIKDSVVSLGVSPEKVSILPIQGNLESFISVGENRKYGFSKPIKFLYVGRFSEEKNLQLLIKVFSNVVANFPNTILTLLGDGAQKTQLTKLVLDLNLEDKVTFLPWTDSVPTIMSAHDVLCLSSNHEGWGMVLLEAAASGMPVITTSVGCAGEVIINDRHGQIVPVGDEGKYIEALKKYLTFPDLIEEHGKKGLILAKNQILPEEEYLEKMVEIWSSCVN